MRKSEESEEKGSGRSYFHCYTQTETLGVCSVRLRAVFQSLGQCPHRGTARPVLLMSRRIATRGPCKHPCAHVFMCEAAEHTHLLSDTIIIYILNINENLCMHLGAMDSSVLSLSIALAVLEFTR